MMPPPRRSGKEIAKAAAIGATESLKLMREDRSTGELFQPDMVTVDESWKRWWKQMPEFVQKDLEPWKTLLVHFACEDDRKAFAQLLGQRVSDDTKMLWYPKADIAKTAHKRYLDANPMKRMMPRHPIYVISKGRYAHNLRLTSRALEDMRVPYRICVEPQEFDEYAKEINPKIILKLPFSNLGQGSIPVRNWVWQHSIDEGHKWHWVLDDNICAFWRLNNNLKIRIRTGATFRAIEDWVDRYSNVGQAGMNYYMFAARKTVLPPLILNTRVYSCMLIKNDLPLAERWRGRYNEDTDLSIRILRSGWCTALFNAFLAQKMPTMTMQGGNTDKLYQVEGRLKMAQSLKEQHPDLVTIIERWDRPQHYVNYRIFRNMELKLKDGVKLKEKPDNFGMILKVIDGPQEPEPTDEESMVADE